jgi:hypothetical protein
MERKMRHKLLAVFVVLVAFLLSTSVLARAVKQADPRFAVMFISQLPSDSQQALARARITKTHTAAVQRLLQRNPVLTNGLRAHGVQLGNVVYFDRAFDGGFIFYVR